MVSIDDVARVAHETNKAYCQALGDHSQPPWSTAPDWQRSSAREGVLFHLNNPGSPPSSSHDSWLAVKHKDGWVYGEKKDAEKKTTHP